MLRRGPSNCEPGVKVKQKKPPKEPKKHPGPRKTYKAGSFGAARAADNITLTGIQKMIRSGSLGQRTTLRRGYQDRGLLGK